jgi:hypothetical protein
VPRFFPSNLCARKIKSPAKVCAMFHLVYFSSVKKPFTNLELQELLREARQKNPKLGVTGMLLYK